MKLQPLCLAAALLASSAYAEEKKDQKPATKPATTQPTQKPAPFTPPSALPVRPNPAPTNTVPNAVNRLRSNPYEVNTAPRTAPFVGAAQGGAKRDLDRITKTGGSTSVFDGGRGSTLNSGVKPNPVVVTSTSTYRPALSPSSVSQPRQPRPTPPSPTTSSSSKSSSSPSLKDRLKNLLR